MWTFHARATRSVSYAITKLSSFIPQVTTLVINSTNEKVLHVPMVPNKFFHLKYLEINLCASVTLSPAFDYLSLVSFLDASPVLESFILRVSQDDMKHDSAFDGGSASHMWEMPEHKHDWLKNVQIIGFCSAKSMVELICHILKNATSLESLELDPVCENEDYDDIGRCSVGKNDKCGCGPITKRMKLEARKALKAVKRYIVGKVPPTVELDVREPCSRCHVIEL
ncbi:hypothetical protein ACP4OV_025738 [Aristida adscensionis]